MKRFALFLLLAMSSLQLSASVAPEPTKIGFVNFESAFAQEHEAQKHTADLEKEERGILETEEKARRDMELKMAKFQESMPKLSDKARQDQQTVIGKELDKLQQDLSMKRAAHTKKRQEILGRFGK